MGFTSQRLLPREASIYSEMLPANESDVRVVRENMSNRLRRSLMVVAVMAIATAPLRAQLVRDDKPQAPLGKESTQTSQPGAEPLGKRRISQEIQLTGDQLWSDTGVDVLPGDHEVLVVAFAHVTLHPCEHIPACGPGLLCRRELASGRSVEARDYLTRRGIALSLSTLAIICGAQSGRAALPAMTPSTR